jgi:hypothetical protein
MSLFMETGPTCIRVINLETDGNGPDDVCEIEWQELRAGTDNPWRLADERGSLLDTHQTADHRSHAFPALIRRT